MQALSNPCPQSVTISLAQVLSTISATVQLLDPTGRLVYQQLLQNARNGIVKTEINVGLLAKGLYLLRVTATDGNTWIQRLVVGE
jgi:hypothetical protein